MTQPNVPQPHPANSAEVLAMSEPSSVDRVVAAAAHLGMFAGFWFLAPLAIYFWKKDESRFVSFHAAQALLLCFMQLAISTGGLIAYLIGTILIVAIAGVTKSEPMVLIGWALVALAAIAVALAPTVLSIMGGYHAFLGRTWKMPIVGRMVEGWLTKRDAERASAAAKAP